MNDPFYANESAGLRENTAFRKGLVFVLLVRIQGGEVSPLSVWKTWLFCFACKFIYRNSCIFFCLSRTPTPTRLQLLCSPWTFPSHTFLRPSLPSLLCVARTLLLLSGKLLVKLFLSVSLVATVTSQPCVCRLDLRPFNRSSQPTAYLTKKR